MSWFNRFSNLFRRENVGKELDEELQFHLYARTRDNLNAGMNAEAAQHNARRRFGNATLARERAHEMDIVMSLEAIGRDLRYALRSLRKSPGFTVVAVLTLALGFGVNTAVFTVVNGVLLRPLPFPEPGRLFLISYQSKQGMSETQPGQYDTDYLEYEKHNQAFGQIATFNEDSATLTGAGDAARVPTAMVTSSFFPVLQVNPVMGRTFLPGEERQGNNRVALLSDKIWRDRFGASPKILGRTITLDGSQYNVVGIMPAGFTFPHQAAIWLPLAVGADPGNTYIRPVVGRLRLSVSRQQALAELEAFAKHIPPIPGVPRESMVPGILPLNDLLVAKIRTSLLIFMGAVAFVLIIACANVANLLLMRGTTRSAKSQYAMHWEPAAAVSFGSCSPRAHSYRCAAPPREYCWQYLVSVPCRPSVLPPEFRAFRKYTSMLASSLLRSRSVRSWGFCLAWSRPSRQRETGCGTSSASAGPPQPRAASASAVPL